MEAFFLEKQILQASAFQATPLILLVHLMDRLARVEGMTNQRLPHYQSVGLGVTFGQPACGMQPVNAYANTPPLT